MQQVVSHLSVRDAAGLLHVNQNTIYRWIQEGRVPVNRIDGKYRFKPTALLEWATSRKAEASVALYPEIQKTPAETHRTGRLTEALQLGGVFHDVKGHDKPSALRNVVESMQLPSSIDRKVLYQLLLARESLGSTGIGDGIAVPHPRSPIVVRVEQPAIVLSFLEHPIDFGAVDGQPVHTLFTLISPTVRDHLRLLSGLAYALRDAEFRKAVVHQASAAEILAASKRIEERLKHWPGHAQQDAA